MAGAASRPLQSCATLPISFRFDPTHNIVRLECTGAVTDAEVTDVIEAVYGSPGHQPGMHELLDCLGVTQMRVTPAAVRSAARLISDRLDRHGVGWRIAIVTRSAVIFALARMYQMLRDESPEQVQVFRSLDAAEAWILSPSPRATPS